MGEFEQDTPESRAGLAIEVRFAQSLAGQRFEPVELGGKLGGTHRSQLDIVIHTRELPNPLGRVGTHPRARQSGEPIVDTLRTP